MSFLSSGLAKSRVCKFVASASKSERLPSKALTAFAICLDMACGSLGMCVLGGAFNYLLGELAEYFVSRLLQTGVSTRDFPEGYALRLCVCHNGAEKLD